MTTINYRLSEWIFRNRAYETIQGYTWSSGGVGRDNVPRVLVYQRNLKHVLYRSYIVREVFENKDGSFKVKVIGTCGPNNFNFKDSLYKEEFDRLIKRCDGYNVIFYDDYGNIMKEVSKNDKS